MSVEEDVELRDLVAQTLETNGCLAKIRAELRASIFLALDEDVKISQHQPLLNSKIKTCLETIEGRTMFCVVREFLEFFNLQFTLSVFEPETYSGNVYHYEGREKAAKDLGLGNLEDTTVPLLQQLIRIAQGRSKLVDINLNLNNNSSIEKSSCSPKVDSRTVKTDTNSVVSTPSAVSTNNKSLEKNISLDVDIKALNATFDVNSPTVDMNTLKKTVLENSHPKKLLPESNIDQIKEDDTYEDTSVITEDSVALTNSDNSPLPQDIRKVEAPSQQAETERKIVKETKSNQEFDKKIPSPKPDKAKSKNNLSSLSDLPPIQLSKSRGNDILPSLYSKEFKEKSNLKELDKMFDMDAEYEEDFGDDLSLNNEFLRSGNSQVNLLDISPPPINPTPSPDKQNLNKSETRCKTYNSLLNQKGGDKNENNCNTANESLEVNLNMST